MDFSNADRAKKEYIYGAFFSLANRMQILGDKTDPEISLKQWFVLAAVFKFTGVPNLGDISRLLGTSRQNIKKISLILEQKGYFKLEKDPDDSRNIRLYLTSKCHEYCKKREQQEYEYFRNLLCGIENETLEALYTGIKKLIENTDRMLNDEEAIKIQACDMQSQT